MRWLGAWGGVLLSSGCLNGEISWTVLVPSSSSGESSSFSSSSGGGGGGGGGSPPAIAGASYRTFLSGNPVEVGSNLGFDLDDYASGSASDAGMTYACAWDRDVDGSVASGADCATLPGTVTLNTATGVFSWTPSYGAFGAYELRFTGTNVGGTDFQLSVIDIRVPAPTSNLRAHLDAAIADAAAPASNPYGVWYDLLSPLAVPFTILGAGASSGWLGGSGVADPWRLSFNGTNTNVSLGTTPLGTSSAMTVSLSYSALSASASGTVIAANGGGYGGGFLLRQSQTEAGTLELFAGRSYYEDLVYSHGPVAYWRLGEATGTAADNFMTGDGTDNLSYPGGVSPTTGALSSDTDPSFALNGTNYAWVASSMLTSSDRYALEAWIKTSTSGVGMYIVSVGGNSTGQSTALYLSASGSLGIEGGFGTVDSSGPSLADGVWHHVAGVVTAGSVQIYIDGYPDASGSFTPAITTGWAVVGRGVDGTGSFTGTIDEVAVYRAASGAALDPTEIRAHYLAGLPPLTASRVLAFDPVSFWKLDERAGSVADDAMGAVDGSYGSGASRAQAPHTGAEPDDAFSAGMSGSGSDHVTIPNGPAHSFNFVAAITAWVKLSSTAGSGLQTILTKGEGSGAGIALQFNDTTDKFEAAVTNTSLNAFAAQGSTTASAGTWYHLAAVRSGGILRLFVNGQEEAGATASGTLAYSGASYIGADQGFLAGQVDDAAFFDHALTSGQVRAIYGADPRYYCRGRTALASNEHTHVTATHDGSSMTLFVNGRPECSVSALNPAGAPDAGLRLGSDHAGADLWSGGIVEARVYDAGMSAADAASAFRTTMDRARNRPIGDVSVTGLSLHYDAASGKNGLVFPGSGCPTSNWWDLATGVALDGIFYNFSSCGSSSGFQGSGASNDPYRLTFDGTDDYVKVPYNGVISASEGTAIFWYRGQPQAQNQSFLTTAQSMFTDLVRLNFSLDSDGKLRLYVEGGATSTSPTLSWNPSSWNHVAFTWQSSGPASRTMYVNGYSVSYSTAEGGLGNAGAYAMIGNSTYCRISGCGTPNDGSLQGDLGAVRIYSGRALTGPEVRADCRLHAASFGGPICSP